MEILATIINGYRALTVVADLSILNVCESSEYTSECITYKLCQRLADLFKPLSVNPT